MAKRIFTLCFLLTGMAFADQVQTVIDQALEGLTVTVSENPYSKTIQRMHVGLDENGQPKVGVAYREIESFKTITGVVIVDKTDSGFVLREAVFPDIEKIRNAEDRRQVLTILKQFKNIPFDPHAEKSAVDGISGATRYGRKVSGYLNYMARRIALEMENPSDWIRKN